VVFPWDKESSKFENQKIIPLSEFEHKLRVKLNSDDYVGIITSRTSGKRVESIEINGIDFSGEEIRGKLQLDSSDFSWYRE
jgi:stage II sporulation protein D